MNYDPIKDKLMISTGDAQNAAFLLKYSLGKMRELAGLPLDRYERSGFLTNHDHAAISIIEAANKLGIDLGVTPHNHNKLDLRDL